jgi:hypothetical protein
MRCVECHSSWNWVSGRIETGAIHNPEYFDWLKNQTGTIPRNPLDFLCGREIDHNFISTLLKVFPRTTSKSAKDFTEIARNIIHIRLVETLRFGTGDVLEDNLQMRIDFMRNKIEKEDFKKKIQKKEKEREKKHEINNVLTMYVGCMTDIFYRLLASPHQTEEIYLEMNALRCYSNDSLSRISTTFNSKKYEINRKFQFC